MKQLYSIILILVSSLLLSNVGYGKTFDKPSFDKEQICPVDGAVISATDVYIISWETVSDVGKHSSLKHNAELNNKALSFHKSHSALGSASSGIHACRVYIPDLLGKYALATNDKAIETFYHLEYKHKLLQTAIRLS